MASVRDIFAGLVLLPVALPLVLGGCRVGPDVAPPPVPASRAVAQGAFLRAGSAAATAPVARWWEGLGDPALNRLVEAGLARAPGIAEAEARLRQARAGLLVAHAGQLPDVSASGTYVHAKVPAQSLGGSLGGSDLTALGFDAQWELDLWGGKRRAVEKARGVAAEQAAGVADAQVSLSAEIVRAYVSLRAAEVARAVMARQVALARQAAALMRQRADAGTAPRQAVEQAEAQASHAAGEAARADAEAIVWRDALAVLTGQAPGALDGLPVASAVDGIPLPPAQVAIGDPGAMLARRPDIRAAKAAYAAATADVGEAEARRYPGISLLGLIGVGGSSVSNLITSGQGVAILMPRLTWDFPDLGRVRAGVRNARAEREAALAAYDGRVLAGLQDAEAALARFGAAREGALRAREGAAHTEAIATLEQQRADAGVIGRGDAIAARISANEAVLGAIQAREGLTLAYAALAKALGLGWQAEGAPGTG